MKKNKWFSLFSSSLEEFKKNDPLRMAGATAFFTTFALPAVLIILIQVFGWVVNPRYMTRKLFNNLGEVVGKNTAGELHKTLFNVRHLFRHGYEAVFGFLFLIFVATTLLKVITDSLNQLWSIRKLPHLGFQIEIVNRGKAFAVILFAGILFLIVLLAEGGIELIKESTNDSAAVGGLMSTMLVRQIVSFLLVTIWFSMLFKFLPDGKPSWKTAVAGSAFTSFLFTLGKLLLQWLLSYSSMQTIYGASTSSVLMLLFVFYSSFIFYYGACFTRAWGELHNDPIQPSNHAEKYEWSQVRA